MRIMAVDDDLLILDLLRECLTKQGGYDLTCCETAEDALQLMEEETLPFDCFLLDIMLPGVDGIELCDMLRQSSRYRTTPILMITASREANLMERAFYAGATDYINKPLDGIELGARINSASMLNDSLHREREIRHTLEELTEKMKLRLEEDVDLEGSGVMTPPELENMLLRMPAGCYSMTLFNIDISGIRGIHRDLTGPQFRYHLMEVGRAACAAMEGLNTMVAYSGHGRFVGAVIGRKRFDRENALMKMNARLSNDWDVAASARPMPPQLVMGALSDQRLWSGLSASNHLRDNSVPPSKELTLGKSQADVLFDRLGEIIGQ